MTLAGILDAAFGRLDWNALPFWEMVMHPSASSIINGLIASGAAGIMVLGALVTAWVLTRHRLWATLWQPTRCSKGSICPRITAALSSPRSLLLVSAPMGR